MVGAAGVSVDGVIVEELMAMGCALVERGVGLVACQKCVHPTLRDYLQAEVMKLITLRNKDNLPTRDNKHGLLYWRFHYKGVFVIQGVLVLERLSSLLLEPVGALCGGEVLGLATPLTVRQAKLGAVADLSRVHFQGQWYMLSRLFPGCVYLSR